MSTTLALTLFPSPLFNALTQWLWWYPLPEHCGAWLYRQCISSWSAQVTHDRQIDNLSSALPNETAKSTGEHGPVYHIQYEDCDALYMVAMEWSFKTRFLKHQWRYMTSEVSCSLACEHWSTWLKCHLGDGEDTASGAKEVQTWSEGGPQHQSCSSCSAWIEGSTAYLWCRTI